MTNHIFPIKRDGGLHAHRWLSSLMCIVAVGGLSSCQKASRLDVHLIEPCDQQNQSLQGVQTIQIGSSTPDPETGYPKEIALDDTNSSTVENGMTPLDFNLDEETFLEVRGYDQAAEDSDASFFNADPYSIGRSVPHVQLAAPFQNDFIGEPASITVPMGRWDSFGQVTSRTESGTQCETLTSGESIAGRHGHTVTYIPAIHKVLIAGGAVWVLDPSGTLEMPQCKEFPNESGGTEMRCMTLLKTAELYDPNTGEFTQLPDLGNQRAFHTATLLSDGKRVLLAGGFIIVDEQLDLPIHGVIYDSEVESDEENEQSPYQTIVFSEQRAHHTATLIPDSKIVVIMGGCTVGGGCTPFGAGSDPSADEPDSTKRFVNPIEVFDETTGEASVPEGLDANELGAFERALHKTVFTGAYILVAGGVTSDGTSCNVELLENSNVGGRTVLTRTQTYTLEVCPVGHTLTALSNGTAFIAGGITDAPGGIPDPNATPVNNVQVWETIGISQGSSMTTGRVDHTAALLADGSVLIVGGRINDNVTAERLVLQEVTQIYVSSPISLPLVESRSQIGAAVMANKHVFVAGGYNAYGITSDRAELYFAE